MAGFEVKASPQRLQPLSYCQSKTSTELGSELRQVRTFPHGRPRRNRPWKVDSIMIQITQGLLARGRQLRIDGIEMTEAVTVFVCAFNT